MNYDKITDDELIKIIREPLRKLYAPSKRLDERIEKNINNKFKGQENKIIEYNNFQRVKIQKRLTLIAAAVLIVLAPIFIFNYLNVSDNLYQVALLVGTVQVERAGEVKSLSVGDSIYQDDKLMTIEGSYCSLVYDDNVIWLNENSELVFNIYNENETVLNLLEGQVITSVASLDEDEIYEIVTNELNVSVVGTVFLVDSGNGVSSVAVRKGIVEIEYIDKEKVEQKVELQKNESILIEKNIGEVKSGLEKKYIDSFNLFEIINATILSEEIGEELPISLIDDTIENIEDESDIYPIEETEIVYEWNINKIHNGTGANIINISTSKYYAVAQSLDSFICFNMSGNLMWKKTYSEVEMGVFDTPAIIYGNKLYASSTKKKLIIVNLDNGRELNVIDIPGVISKNSNMTVYNGIVYLPIADGIYAFDTEDISEDPVITYASAVSLIKEGNNYLMTSFITKGIASYDSNYTEIWNVSLDERIFSNPVFNRSIYVTGYNGNIYKIDYDGNILNQANISNGFISQPVIYNNSIFILSNDGNIVEVSLSNLEIIKNIKIDNNPDPDIYIYKSVIINDKYIIIGSDTGEIIIYNINDATIEKTFNTNSESINASVGFYNDKYFIGNESGDIFLIELSEVG